MTAVTLLCSRRTIWFEADDCWLCHRWWWGAARWAWPTLLPRLAGACCCAVPRIWEYTWGQEDHPYPGGFPLLTVRPQKGSNKGLNYTHICTSFWCFSVSLQWCLFIMINATIFKYLNLRLSRDGWTIVLRTQINLKSLFKDWVDIST